MKAYKQQEIVRRRTYTDLLAENILIATDQDLDGSRIAGIMIGFFAKYAPSIIREGKLHRLRTPVVAVKNKGKIKEFFFDIASFNKYENENKLSKYEIKYYKGLGCWGPGEFEKLIDQHGVEYFIEQIVLDDNAFDVIDQWFGKSNTETRKTYLRENKFSIFSM
jgi:DNA gyrase/topoisomerase IV subunit B